MSAKSTPLYEDHLKQEAKMVEFAGWKMPVEYIGLRKEHLIVREKVGLFDVSHMGEIRVKGSEALQLVEWVTTNHVAKLTTGEAQYTVFPNEQGGIVDDLIVYCLQPNEEYLLCVNASNTEKDFQWVKSQNKFDCEVIDESESWGQIAVQGPKGVELVGRIFGENVVDIKPFKFRAQSFEGGGCYIARTGYTGEDGFEIFVPKDQASKLWNQLLEKGVDLGVQACGLGARDTLRTEMKYSLYGNEITDHTNPYHAGLGWVVKPKLKDFVGKDIILRQKEAGFKTKLIGFVMVDRGIPRHGYKLLTLEGEPAGEVTSGTVSPSLNDNIGIGYLNRELSETGSEFFVDIRGRKVRAKVVDTPFVQKN